MTVHFLTAPLPPPQETHLPQSQHFEFLGDSEPESRCYQTHEVQPTAFQFGIGVRATQHRKHTLRVGFGIPEAPGNTLTMRCSGEA